MTWAPTEAPLYSVLVDPAPENGLRERSFVMVDKAMSIRAEKLGASLSQLGGGDMTRVNPALALFPGIAA